MRKSTSNEPEDCDVYNEECLLLQKVDGNICRMES